MVRRALPASGVSLEALIVAVVAVHEVVGPICFRRALARAGALKEGEHVGESTLAVPAWAHGGQAPVTRLAVDGDAGGDGLRR